MQPLESKEKTLFCIGYSHSRDIKSTQGVCTHCTPPWIFPSLPPQPYPLLHFGQPSHTGLYPIENLERLKSFVYNHVDQARLVYLLIKYLIRVFSSFLIEYQGTIPSVVVGVVGIGHTEGIKENFDKDIDIQELLE